MMLRQYSVSPRVNDRTLGPNPSENVRTRTPIRRAIRKWPSSWTKISTPRTNKKLRMVVICNYLYVRVYFMGLLLGEPAGPAVDRPHVIQGGRLASTRLLIRVHRGGYQNWYGDERNSPFEKGRHRNFVGRIQHNR